MLRKLIAAGSIFLATLYSLPVEAFIPLPDEQGEYSYDTEGNLVINSNFSIENLRAVTKGGSFEVEPDIIRLLGYDPSRSWNPGDRPEDIIKFGDLKFYGLQKFSLKQMNGGANLDDLPLNQLGILEGQSLVDLTRAIPGFSSLEVRQVPLLAGFVPYELRRLTIEELIEEDEEVRRRKITRKVSSELQAYLTQNLELLQQESINSLEEGITTITGAIDTEFNNTYSEIGNIEFESVTSLIKQQARQQIETLGDELTNNINNYIQQNIDLGGDDIARYVEGQLLQYKQNIEVQVETRAEELKQNVLQQVEQKLALAGIASYFNIEREIEAFKTAVSDYGDEVVANLRNQAEAKIIEEYGRIAVIDSIPNSFGDIEFGTYDLSSYTVEDIPGIENTPIENFDDYGNFYVSDAPGAAGVAFNSYPNLPNFGSGLAVVDLVLSEAEGFADRAITGSEREGFNNTICTQGNNLNGGCAHVELAGAFAWNRGKQWVSGDSQEVEGGKNLLRFYGGGKEPTGRLPAYKSPFKMVLRNNDETTDTTELNLALQVCVRDMFGVEHCTPHNVVEFPIHTFRPGDFIFLGITL